LSLHPSTGINLFHSRVLIVISSLEISITELSKSKIEGTEPSDLEIKPTLDSGSEVLVGAEVRILVIVNVALSAKCVCRSYNVEE